MDVPSFPLEGKVAIVTGARGVELWCVAMQPNRCLTSGRIHVLQ
jgi:hypothetical protein